MQELKSCGFIIFRERPEFSFLLMKHADRWDLPKGHVDSGESELDCALRELREETGIRPDDLRFDSRFRFTTRYTVRSKRTGSRAVPKTLVVFLACLVRDVSLQATEHLAATWFPWKPPHKIQEQTINPLLEELERHFASSDLAFDGQPPQSHDH
jgi:8-oxo-dGTP pyrophosphatase MutT (NUDIX family)